MTCFLYPSDYFDSKQVDPDFQDEYEAMHRFPGFKAHLFGYDAFVTEGTLNFYPKIQEQGVCIYRGWMLKPDQYRLLHETLAEQNVQLINSPTEYEVCHLFPNAYAAVEKHTPKAIWFPDKEAIDWNLVNAAFQQFMLKDYVKSVKGRAAVTCWPIRFSAVSGPIPKRN